MEGDKNRNAIKIFFSIREYAFDRLCIHAAAKKKNINCATHETSIDNYYEIKHGFGVKASLPLTPKALLLCYDNTILCKFFFLHAVEVLNENTDLRVNLCCIHGFHRDSTPRIYIHMCVRVYFCVHLCVCVCVCVCVCDRTEDRDRERERKREIGACTTKFEQSQEYLVIFCFSSIHSADFDPVQT